MNLKLPHYQGIIFDLDGTLLDSTSCWKKADAVFFQEHHIKPTPQILEEVKTLHFDQIGNYFIQKHGVKASADEIVNHFSELIEQAYREEIPLKAYVKEFVEQEYHKNIPMAVATATSASLARDALTRLGIFSYFQFLLSCDEIGQSKEQPEIYLQAAVRMETTPKKTLVFEDALHGIQTASLAGFPVIAVSDSTTETVRNQITQYTPYFIEDFSELLT